MARAVLWMGGYINFCGPKNHARFQILVPKIVILGQACMLVIALILILERGVREQDWGSVLLPFHISVTNTHHVLLCCHLPLMHFTTCWTMCSLLCVKLIVIPGAHSVVSDQPWFSMFYKMLNYVLVTVCKTNSNTWCTFCHQWPAMVQHVLQDAELCAHYCVLN